MSVSLSETEHIGQNSWMNDERFVVNHGLPGRTTLDQPWTGLAASSPPAQEGKNVALLAFGTLYDP